MIRGLYTGASGMDAQMHKMDALTNNLANVDVTGYKKDVSVQKAFPELMLRRMNDDGMYKYPFGSTDNGHYVGKLGTGVEQNEVHTIFSQGALKQTDNQFDVALEDKGFMAIDTPDGERYTRNGSFILGKEGLLLTKEGFPVKGENGPIQIKKNNFIIDASGRVFQSNTYAGDKLRLVSQTENEWRDIELVDQLKLVDFRRPDYLQKQGSSFWKANEQSGEARLLEGGERPAVRQGFVEASNVNPVTQMVRLIEVNRNYEANQKTIQTQDSLLGKLINEAIRV